RVSSISLGCPLRVARGGPAAVPDSRGGLAHRRRRGEMSDVVYRSEVRIERVKGPIRKAYLPAEKEPVIFGVHGAVAEHYKVSPAVAEPRATTLDYIVAAAGG